MRNRIGGCIQVEPSSIVSAKRSQWIPLWHRCHQWRWRHAWRHDGGWSRSHKRLFCFCYQKVSDKFTSFNFYSKSSLFLNAISQYLFQLHSPNWSFDSRWNSNFSALDWQFDSKLQFWIELKFHLNSKLQLSWIDNPMQQFKLEFHFESNYQLRECTNDLQDSPWPIKIVYLFFLCAHSQLR